VASLGAVLGLSEGLTARVSVKLRPEALTLDSPVAHPARKAQTVTRRDVDESRSELTRRATGLKKTAEYYRRCPTM
jgi:hypothetical protein